MTEGLLPSLTELLLGNAPNPEIPTAPVHGAKFTGLC